MNRQVITCYVTLYTNFQSISNILLYFILIKTRTINMVWVMCMFNEKLRFLRKYQHLTQTEVAEELNLNQRTYSQYETGANEPNFETLKKLANFFDVSIDYLLENDRSLSDSEEIVDLNDFLLNGRYTIHSKFPTDKERRMLNGIVNNIFED